MYQSLLFEVVVTCLHRRTVPRAALFQPLGRIPIVRTEKHDWIGPAVRTPHGSGDVGLEEGEINYECIAAEKQDVGVSEIDRSAPW